MTRILHRSNKRMKVIRKGNVYMIEFKGKSMPKDSNAFEGSFFIIELLIVTVILVLGIGALSLIINGVYLLIGQGN